jgi:hypothetical protein
MVAALGQGDHPGAKVLREKVARLDSDQGAHSPL